MPCEGCEPTTPTSPASQSPAPAPRAEDGPEEDAAPLFQELGLFPHENGGFFVQ